MLQPASDTPEYELDLLELGWRATEDLQEETACGLAKRTIVERALRATGNPDTVWHRLHGRAREQGECPGAPGPAPQPAAPF